MVIKPDFSDIGKRIDSFIAERTELTRSAVVGLIEKSNITVSGQKINKNYKLKGREEIEIILPPPQKLEVEPQKIPLDIVYEDDDIIVVNKKQGMVVHPAAGNSENTLVNALLSHCGDNLSGINGVIRPGIVHRIDKDTSGLLVVAKSNAAHLGLAAQIKEHSFLRIYNAIVVGCPKAMKGSINAPIGRNPTDRKKMAVTKAGKVRTAITHYTVLRQLRGFSLVEFKLETGRTHQIRVHSAYIGHPVLGDPIYSKTAKESDKFGLSGQCLHAKSLGFFHPITNQWIEFDSELPEYFTEIIKETEI